MKTLLLLSVLLFLPIAANYPRIINVPSEYLTIQEAIDASVSGDTIVVAPGRYKENINFNGKNVLLTSNFLHDQDVNTILNTIIDGGYPENPDFASCVMFISGEDSSAILQGFTLTNGKGSRWVDEHGAGVYREGGGILSALSAPTIRFNYITGNEAINKSGMISAGGGGIRAGDGNASIYNNVISHNKGRYGAGIVLNYTGAVVRNNIISQNEGGEDFGGGGIWINHPSGENLPIIIENNTIVGNISNISGGGLRIISTIVSGKNNIIWGNSAVTLPSSGIDVSGSTAVLSYNCVQGGWTGNGNISSDPLFAEGTELYLSVGSPCIDAGDTSFIYNDNHDSANASVPKFPSLGSLRNDIGAYGGPFAKLLPPTWFSTKLFFSVLSVGFKQITYGDSTIFKIDLTNSSQVPAEIDSVTIFGNNGIRVLHYPQSIQRWSTDSVLIQWKPLQTGTITDTLKVYHNDTTQFNPVVIKLIGRARTPVSVSDKENIPEEYKLFQNYPNPFNPQTTISFNVAEPGNVKIIIYNLTGKEITTLINKHFNRGKYSIPFTAENLSSGIYYYKLYVNRFSAAKKFILLK